MLPATKLQNWSQPSTVAAATSAMVLAGNEVPVSNSDQAVPQSEVTSCLLAQPHSSFTIINNPGVFF